MMEVLTDKLAEIEAKLSQNISSQSLVPSRGGPEDLLLLQPLWSTALRHSYYTSSPVFPIAVYVVTYILLQLPFTTLDVCSERFPGIKRYRTQPDVEMSWATIRPAFTTTCWNHLLYVIPVSVAQVGLGY